MSVAISIMSRPEREDDLRWRRDGEEDQIVILHKDEFPLPQILNPTAAEIFLQCDGKKTVEEIVEAVSSKFNVDDLEALTSEVKRCITRFRDKGIVKV